MCNLSFIMRGIVVLWKRRVCELANILDFIYLTVSRILLFFFTESYYNSGKLKNEAKILKTLTFEKEISLLMNTRKTTSVYLEATSYSYTETSLQESELITNRLIAGVGALISILLFIIVVQLCKNSRSDRKKIELHKMNKINDISDEFTGRSNINSSKENKKIFSPQQSNHRFEEAMYLEIEDDVEKGKQIPASLTVAGYRRSNAVSFDFEDINSLEIKNEYLSAQTNDLYLSPTINDTSDSYIQPIFVRKIKANE